ncbi:cytochrome c oxidase subunit [Cystoisospora suis]|uniref:Cytochrome c oxidase polypeptide II n=1 Tax=Cystoisospora suis TaxID=483139 RepID=A0A2C6L3A8_9APIC|nr:cytochrome c oxidase subunit [Cystoisospora suis]
MDLFFRSFFRFSSPPQWRTGKATLKREDDGESPSFSPKSIAKCQSLPENSPHSSSTSSSSSLIFQSLKASASSSSGDGENTSFSSKSPILKNVSAADYPTPQKYLDNPEKIPSYYVFQSNMVTDEDLQPGMLRNLEVDKRLTLPTRTHIRFLITATDVIHAWSIPALGIKADAIPGRLQRINTFIQREGVFYGQCSELCGALHGFMPIVVEAVSPETYAAHAKKWYKE